MLTWQKQVARDRRRRNWISEPSVETRQEYANHFVAEYQRAWESKVTWHNLLAVFRSAGLAYDHGCRLRDEVAA